jgi:hypothetical protein
MISKDVKRYLSEIARRGGSAGTGSAKVRGDSEYYSKLRTNGIKKAKRARKNENL